MRQPYWSEMARQLGWLAAAARQHYEELCGWHEYYTDRGACLDDLACLAHALAEAENVYVSLRNEQRYLEELSISSHPATAGMFYICGHG